jgi:hypothetical protein
MRVSCGSQPLISGSALTIIPSTDNEKKRLAKQLQDSERRLLAMSAELAKAKGLSN